MGITSRGQRANDTVRRLHDLFKEDWEWSLRESPEWATYLGDNRYNDRLSDLSPEAIDRRKAHDREMLSRIEQIDRKQLVCQDAISHDLFRLDKQQRAAGQRFPLALIALTQLVAQQIGVGQPITSMLLHTVGDYENYISRIEAFPASLHHIIAFIRRGIEAG